MGRGDTDPFSRCCVVSGGGGEVVPLSLVDELIDAIGDDVPLRRED
jgi:hypothetical protein